jgi:hypothetical protein
MSVIIILGAIWCYPIITYFLLWFTRKNTLLRKRIVYTSLIITGLTAIGILTDISTTVAAIDWILLTSIYFTFTLLLWLTLFIKNKLIRIPAIIIAGIIFGVCYLMGSVGALGIGFVAYGFETRKEQWLTDGIIYKETPLGNALSDYRGKKVEIYKTIPWFPIIEWKTQTKKYYNLIVYQKTLHTDYRPAEKKLYLSASMRWVPKGTVYYFADTLSIR